MSEENSRYSVLIVGIDGIEGGPPAAAARLAAKFRLPRANAEQLVDSIPAIVKKDITRNEAQRYVSAIRSIGAEARVVPFRSDAVGVAKVTGIVRPLRRGGGDKGRESGTARSSGSYINVNRRRCADNGEKPDGVAETSGSYRSIAPGRRGERPLGNEESLLDTPEDAPPAGRGADDRGDAAAVVDSPGDGAEESSGVEFSVTGGGSEGEGESAEDLFAWADALPDPGTSAAERAFSASKPELPPDAAPGESPDPADSMDRFSLPSSLSGALGDGAGAGPGTDQDDGPSHDRFTLPSSLPAMRSGDERDSDDLAAGGAATGDRPAGDDLADDPFALPPGVMRAGAGSQESADDGASGDAAPDVDDLDWDRNALTEMDEAAAKQLEEPGPGIAKKRPTLFDELMAIDSDPAIDRTELGDLLPGSGSTQAANEKPSEEARARKTPDRSGPSLSDDGNLDLGGSSNLGDALELDTDKEHLTGHHEAISLEDGDPRGVTGSRPPATEMMSALDLTGFSGSSPSAGPGRAGSRSASGDSGVAGAPGMGSGAPPPTRPAPGDGPSHVVGGFSAKSERSRSRGKRVYGFLKGVFLLGLLAGIGFGGWYGWTIHSGNVYPTQFASSQFFYEFQLRVGDGYAIRACAGRDDNSFLCRYSVEFFREAFPDAELPVAELASATCFGTLTDDGTNMNEEIDCVVEKDRGGELRRYLFRYESYRRCASSLLELEPERAVECDCHAGGEMSVDRAVPSPGPPRPEKMRYEFRRELSLNTDVGYLPAREYSVTSESSDLAELVYIAPDVGLVVRRARLAGSTTLRLTYMEEPARGGGQSVWPR